MRNKKAFTLVELIIVIAVVAILAAAIFVAVDPARRLHETRNARRSADISTILDAVKKYQVDNEGTHYTTVASMTTNLHYQIGTGPTNCAITCFLDNTQGDCVDLSGIGSNYLAQVPYDPKDGDSQRTGYSIMLDSNGAITLRACYGEGEGAGGGGTEPWITLTR